MIPRKSVQLLWNSLKDIARYEISLVRIKVIEKVASVLSYYISSNES